MGLQRPSFPPLGRHVPPLGKDAANSSHHRWPPSTAPSLGARLWRAREQKMDWGGGWVPTLCGDRFVIVSPVANLVHMKTRLHIMNMYISNTKVLLLTEG